MTITAATFVQAGGDPLATNSMTRGEYSGPNNSISKMYVAYTGYPHLAWDGVTGEASYNATVANGIQRRSQCCRGYDIDQAINNEGSR